MRRLRRLGDKSNCCRSSRSRPNSGARPGSTSRPAPGLLACLTATVRASSSARRRARRRGGRGRGFGSATPQPPAPLPEPVCVSTMRSTWWCGCRASAAPVSSRLADRADGGAAEGRWSTGLDQTGLAQKGGPVISDVRLAPAADDGAPRAAGGEVDVLLGLELLGAVAPEILRTLDPERTVAVVNIHETATAAMISDVDSPRSRWPIASPACGRRRSPTRRCSSTPARSPSRCSATTCRPT